MEFSGAASSGGMMYRVNTIPVRLWPGLLIFSVGHERVPNHPTMRRPVLSYADLNPHMFGSKSGRGSMRTSLKFCATAALGSAIVINASFCGVANAGQTSSLSTARASR